jgi:hypothetical protein
LFLKILTHFNQLAHTAHLEYQVSSLMKITFLHRWLSWIGMGLCVGTAAVYAQSERIYRCGNEYTNRPEDIKGKDCKPIDGNGYVSVVKVPAPASKSPRPKSGPDSTDKSPEQKARDSDARAILEDELRKSEQRLGELKGEYNNGEPEKLGPEHKNHQKYLDRVAELKSNIQRSESDIEGIKRELSRLR